MLFVFYFFQYTADRLFTFIYKTHLHTHTLHAAYCDYLHILYMWNLSFVFFSSYLWIISCISISLNIHFRLFCHGFLFRLCLLLFCCLLLLLLLLLFFFSDKDDWKNITYKYEYMYCLETDINKIRNTGSFVKVLCFTDIQINISIPIMLIISSKEIIAALVNMFFLHSIRIFWITR